MLIYAKRDNYFSEFFPNTEKNSHCFLARQTFCCVSFEECWLVFFTQWSLFIIFESQIIHFGVPSFPVAEFLFNNSMKNKTIITKRFDN